MHPMQINPSRFQAAFKAMTVHLGLSLLVAAVVALLVFTLWFPYPYRELAGGSELFILVMAVDIVCGPLLTFVLFSPTKPKKELRTDISLIVVIQLLALSYGIWNVWMARPIYLVQEADRFNIISRSSIDTRTLDELPTELKTKFFKGPIRVSLRDLTKLEQIQINTEISLGGHDKSETPNFYTAYDGNKAYEHGRPLQNFLLMQPDQLIEVNKLIAADKSQDLNKLHYLYFVGRQFWISVVNPSGEIIGYIKGK